MKKIFSLFAALLFVGSMWGAVYFEDTFSNVGTGTSGNILPRTGWSGSGTTAPQGNSGVRVGASSSSATITKTAMTNIEGTVTLKVTVYTCRYNTNANKFTVTAENGTIASVSGVGTLSDGTLTIAPSGNAGVTSTSSAATWTDSYKTVFTITGASSSTTISFTSDKRTILGPIKIEDNAVLSAVTITNPLHGTVSVKNGETNVTSGTSIAQGTELSVSVSGSGYTFTPRAFKTGDESTAVTITAGKLTMPAYAITITADEAEITNPNLSASVSKLDWERVAKASELKEKNFTIEGAYLEAGSLSLTLQNAGESNFEVDPESIDVDGTLATTKIKVTPKSTANVGVFEDKLIISGGGLSENVEIDLKLTVLETYTVDWYINEVKKGSQTDTVGAELTDIPNAELAANGALSGKTFLGWAESAILTPTNEKPTISTPSAITAANKEYHAVYATQLTPAVSEYRLVSTISTEKTYVFVSANEAGEAYALPAKDMATSSTGSINGVGVTISEENEIVKIKTLNTKLEYYCAKINLGGGDTLILQVVEDNTKYLCINGSGMDKRSNSYKAFWDTSKGLYGTNSAGSKLYYIEAGEKFEKLAENTAPTNRVYAFERTVVAATYNAYVTKGYAVTIAATTNGSIKVKNGTTEIASGEIFANGTTLTIVASPASGYQLSAITVVNTETEDDVTDEVLSGTTLTVPAYAITVSASFDVASAIDNAEAEVKAVKFIENGQLFIIKNGHVYNVQGQIVK